MAKAPAAATKPAPAIGGTPTGRHIAYFRALRDFEWINGTAVNHYVKGMTYTVRENNDALAKALVDWISEGKAEPHEPGAKIGAPKGADT